MIEQPKADVEFEWEAVASALFAEQGITSGHWRLGVKLSFGGITANWEEIGSAQPTALVGMVGLAFFKVDGPGPMVFDAATARKKKVKAAPSKPEVAIPKELPKRRLILTRKTSKADSKAD
jgi:hypothetical protein